MRTSFLLAKAALGCALLLAGCGGGGDSTTPPPPTPTTYTIGGTVTGLATGASVVLQNNGAGNLSVAANGAFTFASAVNSGASYAVTVLTQPSTPAQTCTVTSGSGTASANVTSVSVTCVTPPPATYTIGGTVSGLAGGTSVVLQNNAGNNLTVSANGAFTFSTAITSGATYAVTVLTQPTGPAQTCVVANGSGTAAANVSNVAITCTTAPVPTYTIGGTVSGLAGGASVVLQNNAGNNLTVNANGTFTFSAAINSGATYLVTVLTQRSTPVQACAVTGGTGTASANVTNVVITCVTPVVPTYTIGGTVSGLAGGATLVLRNNGGDDRTVSANGVFTFATSVTSGGAYSVVVSTQPTSPVQNCVVANGSGTASAIVTNVVVTCTTMTFTVGGSVTGLATGGSVTLQNNAGDNLPVAANGAFTFATAINSGATYTVTVSLHPTVPGVDGQTCVVTNGSGTVAGANIATVTVTCSNDDTTAPTVLSRTPLPTAIGSKVQGGVVTVTFSEAMLPSSVTVTSLTLTGPAGPVSGAVALSAGDTVATFTPTARIAFDAEYTVAVTTAVRDASNNAIAAGASWKFNSGKSLAVGDQFTCARVPSGDVKCWGDNTYGQLGYDDTQGRGDGVGPGTAALVAVNLGAGRTAVAVAAADYVACAILDDGSAKCWGRNHLGQLGQGVTGGVNDSIGDQAGEMLALQPINFGVGRKAMEISVGQDFACARLDDATLKCWGDSSRGQLGQPNGTPLGVAPGDIAAAPAIALGTGLSPVLISLGHYHACAILVTGGGARSAKCWGDNNWGQVGRGDTDLVGNDPNELGDFLPAVNFGAGRTPKYLMATGGHTCAQLDDDSTKCWGLNTWGQVGLNVSNNSPISDTVVERRTCNGNGAGVRPNACIGDELPTELGDTLVAAIPAGETVRLTSGYRHNCVVRTTGSVVNCWGSNEQAQLGIGTGGTLGTSDSIKGDEAGDMASFVATPMKSARTIEELSGGGFQTCVVTTASGDYEINCWGDNTKGQLGRNSVVSPIGDAIGEMGDNLVDVDLSL